MYNASEATQVLMLAVCFALSLVRALRVRNAVWLEIVCFFACMLFGNVYYFGVLVVFGETPHYSYIPDLSWIAGYIFLLMLLVECDQQRGPIAPIPAAWIPAALCAALCVFYIYSAGDPLLNIVDNGLVGALAYFAVRGLLSRPEEDSGHGFAGSRPLHAIVLVFVIVEQGLWLSSLIPDSGPDYTVYTVFNFALSLSYAAILAGAWKLDDL